MLRVFPLPKQRVLKVQYDVRTRSAHSLELVAKD